MKECPNCKCDYIDEALNCSDCKIPLIVKRPTSDDNKKTSDVFSKGSEKLLIKVTNETEADLIREYLASNGIPVLFKYEGLGGYMKLYMGTSPNDALEIYVLDDLYDKAQALMLNYMEMIEVDEQYYIEDTEDNKSYKNLDRYMAFRKISKILIFLIFIFPLLFITVFQLINIF